MQPLNLVIASRKGGAGKTTLSTNLAAALPGRVCLLDCDPRGDSANWARIRAHARPSRVEARVLPLAAARRGSLRAALQLVAGTHLIVDTPPDGDHAIDLTTVLVSSCSAPDLAATAASLRGPGRILGVVLCVCPGPRSRHLRAARERVAELGVPLLGEISRRAAFVDAIADGRGATETRDSAAAAEISQVLRAIRRMVR